VVQKSFLLVYPLYKKNTVIYKELSLNHSFDNMKLSADFDEENFEEKV